MPLFLAGRRPGHRQRDRSDAHERLAESAAVPDVGDVAETTTLVAAVAENMMKVNSLMVGRAIADSQGAVVL
jgi:hypothetical protein